MTDKRRWKFLEGKEQYFVYGAISVFFIVLIAVVGILYGQIVSKIKLETKFESEKAFNSIHMAMNESLQKALRTMEKEKVKAFGIYTSAGVAYQTIGDAPEHLPIGRLIQAKQKGDDSTYGIFIFNKNSNDIEYFRLSRFIVSFELESSTLSVSKNAGIPDILYVKFDGMHYYNRLRVAGFMAFFVVIVIAVSSFVSLNMYLSNRRYRMELARNKSLAELGTAARTLTHEIKNPLSAMTIQSALLRKEIPQEFSGDLDLIDHEIQRLTNLTNRVSEFLKNPSGKESEIELVSFLTDISRLFSKKITLNFNNVSKAVVLFDEDRARSVFENLIKNACESSADRDPQVEIVLRLGKKESVVVQICDRGDGIPESVRDKLFDPFFTTKTYGSGIGLSISRQFVKARGGSLKLFDRDGGGTIAEVVLPCIREIE